VIQTTIIAQGKVYLDESHISLLRAEPEYVKKRYQAVSRTLTPFGVTRERAAEMIGRSKRQFQRIVRRFKEEGIPGLRFKSKRPHTTPWNKTPLDIERRVIEVRNATGFGSDQLAAIVNESLRLECRNPITDTTCYNILVRNDLVEAEQRAIKRYKSFEWGHPDELIQCDLTEFNGYPILTMLDDHSREGWTGRIENPTDDMVVDGMTYLHPDVFENLLTDNGSQFCRMNSTMRKYCEMYVTGKHIWSTVHHPLAGEAVRVPEGTEGVPHPQAGKERRQARDRRMHTHLCRLAQQRIESQDDQMLPGGEVLWWKGPSLVREARQSS